MRHQEKPIDIRAILKKAAVAVLSRPIFFALGAVIVIPKLFLDSFLSQNTSLQNFLKALESESPAITFPPELFLLLLLAVFALIAGSLGRVSLIIFANSFENNTETPFPKFRSDLFRKTLSVFRLEIVLIALTSAIGLLLAIPSTIALFQGLGGLAHALSLSALGLIFSIALLFFFLRQYAVLYLSLSKVSLRAALENAARLFRIHTRKTVFLSVALFGIELLLFFSLILIETLISSSRDNLSFSISPRNILVWAVNLLVFSIFEAWNWTTWTYFFRTIALPKEPEPVLQKEESVLQQESAVSLDKA